MSTSCQLGLQAVMVPILRVINTTIPKMVMIPTIILAKRQHADARKQGLRRYTLNLAAYDHQRSQALSLKWT